MANVPREPFVAEELAEFAYEDTPLPIESRPDDLAALHRRGDGGGARARARDDRVLEIGTGSGYAAAVLGRIAGEVYTIERHDELADAGDAAAAPSSATTTSTSRCGDGTLGWPEHAPFDAIVVAAGGPEVPQALLEQLADRRPARDPGRARAARQELRPRARAADDEFTQRGSRRGALRAARSARRAGSDARRQPRPLRPPRRRGTARRDPPHGLTGRQARREAAEPLGSIEDAELEAAARAHRRRPVVLLGEATHGTSEFYRMRARITRELIRRHGFTAVAVEADWPDAARVDHYVRGIAAAAGAGFEPFARFPTWMWRNREVRAFVEWLRDHNARGPTTVARSASTGSTSTACTRRATRCSRYLDGVDPDAAAVARASATAASRRGSTIRPRTAAPS